MRHPLAHNVPNPNTTQAHSRLAVAPRTAIWGHTLHALELLHSLLTPIFTSRGHSTPSALPPHSTCSHLSPTACDAHLTIWHQRTHHRSHLPWRTHSLPPLNDPLARPTQHTATLPHLLPTFLDHLLRDLRTLCRTLHLTLDRADLLASQPVPTLLDIQPVLHPPTSPHPTLHLTARTPRGIGVELATVRWESDRVHTRDTPATLWVHTTLAHHELLDALAPTPTHPWPTAIAPQQATILPIATRHLPWARHCAQTARAHGIRTPDPDPPRGPLGPRIAAARALGIPHIAIIGDRELDARALCAHHQPHTLDAWVASLGNHSVPSTTDPALPAGSNHPALLDPEETQPVRRESHP